MLLRQFGGLFYPGGPRGRLPVLIYHRVLPQRDPLFPTEVTAQDFDWQMQLLARSFQPLPLSEAARRLQSGSLPARAVCVTFDDGYADNHDVALPILQRHGVHATFFVAPGYLDGGRMWNDTVIEALRRCAAERLDLTPLGMGVHDLSTSAARRNVIDSLLAKLKYLPVPERHETSAAIGKLADVKLPTDLMMSQAQVRALHTAGMGVGGHTDTHPILTRLNLEEARDEIARGREKLVRIIGQPIRLFAYPNGRPRSDYGQEHVKLVQELGFEAAVSTARGVARMGSDLFQLPRFTPWDASPLRFALRLYQNARTRDFARV